MTIHRAIRCDVLAVFLLTLICCADRVVADEETIVRTIHVSPAGDDSGDGGVDAPLRTFHAAQKRVRKTLAENRKQNIIVRIAPGDYFLDEPLVLTHEDTGDAPDADLVPSKRRPFMHRKSARARTRFIGSKLNEVRISGGRKITGWKLDGAHWVTNINDQFNRPPSGTDAITQPRFRDLWINGRRAVRARSPNGGYYRIEKAGPDDRTSFFVEQADLLSLANPQSAEVVFLHDWSTSRVRFAAIESDTRTYRFADPIGPSAPHYKISHFEKHPRYFVENAPELLDAPGEWYLDDASGELRYIPLPGETIDSIEVIAPVLEQLVIVRGDADDGKLAEGIQFQNLSFEHTRFNIPPHGWASSQACFHERRQTPGESDRQVLPAAVQVEHARRCVWHSCRFAHLGGAGIHIQETSTYCTLQGCELTDIGGNGVMIGGTEARHFDTQQEGENGEAPDNGDNGLFFCEISQCGASFYGAVGVWIGIAQGTQVIRCHLFDLPYTGVSVGWKWDDSPTRCGGNAVGFCHIHHVMQTLSDGGGIYTLGRQPGTGLVENLIHDIPTNLGRAESNGMFIDEGSTEISINGNTIYNIAKSPIRFHRAGANKIVRNRLVSRPGVPTFQFNACKPDDKVFSDNEEITAENWAPNEESLHGWNLQRPEVENTPSPRAKVEAAE